MLALVSSMTTAVNGCDSFEKSVISTGLQIVEHDEVVAREIRHEAARAVEHRRIDRHRAHRRSEQRLIGRRRRLLLRGNRGHHRQRESRRGTHSEHSMFSSGRFRCIGAQAGLALP